VSYGEVVVDKLKRNEVRYGEALVDESAIDLILRVLIKMRLFHLDISCTVFVFVCTVVVLIVL